MWRLTYHRGAPTKAVPNKAQPRSSWCADVMVRGVTERSGRFGDGLSGKEGQGRSFTGTLQAPAALFRFPAPSSSQTEGKRENNLTVLLFTLALLRHEEWKHVLWSPLLDLTLNHSVF